MKNINRSKPLYLFSSKSWPGINPFLDASDVSDAIDQVGEGRGQLPPLRKPDSFDRIRREQ